MDRDGACLLEMLMPFGRQGASTSKSPTPAHESSLCFTNYSPSVSPCLSLSASLSVYRLFRNLSLSPRSPARMHLSGLLAHLESRLSEIDFPFLVLHDPDGECSGVVYRRPHHLSHFLVYMHLFFKSANPPSDPPIMLGHLPFPFHRMSPLS